MWSQERANGMPEWPSFWEARRTPITAGLRHPAIQLSLQDLHLLIHGLILGHACLQAIQLFL